MNILEHLHKDAECYGNGEYYVYFWEDEYGEVFYVGSGKKYRAWNINPTQRNKDFMKWYCATDCRPRIAAYGMTQIEARRFEKNLIRAFQRLGYPLTNRREMKTSCCRAGNQPVHL